MVEIKPDLEKHMKIKNGKRILYLRMMKAIYGMIESALLWYEMYVSVLKYMGFTLNPYDMCIDNKTINGKQYTIGWYVDDKKKSHVKQKVVGDVIKTIEERFPGLFVIRGDEHTFLGININYFRGKNEERTGEFVISMKEYVRE